MMQIIEKDIPVIPLWLPVIIGNLIPLCGVLFLGWDIFSIFFLYWVENVVIGIFTALQMFSVGVSLFFIKHELAKIGAVIGTTFFIGFFSIHYGMFTMGHLTLLTSLFYEGGNEGLFMFDLPKTWEFIKVVATDGMWWGIFAILVAEGIKAVIDFRKEPLFQKQFLSGKIPPETIMFLKEKNPDFNPEDIGKVSRMPQLMMAPYGRIVVLHLALLFGGFLAEFLNQPVWALGLLIILKIAYDMGTIDPMKRWKAR